MNKILDNLRSQSNFRNLYDAETSQNYIKIGNNQYLNLSSNDYLGLSDIFLQQQFFENVDLKSHFLMSNPSSRLMTGNTIYYSQIEKYIASLYNKDTSLVLSSGFMLNSGALAAITSSQDIIIADKLVHASIIDGLKLCEAEFVRFKHNDISHLRTLVERAYDKKNCDGNNVGDVIVVLESVYSMDGDTAKLKEIIELKKEFGFRIYIDEAHAFGVRGERGLGVAEELGVIDQIDYLVVTLGKAAVSQGAFIVCDNETKDLMVNRMRTLIFSTALPPLSLMWSKFIIEHITTMTLQRKEYREKCRWFCEQIAKITGEKIEISHIVPVMVGDNAKTLQLAQELKERGFWVTAIRPPTVPKGTSRLRLSISNGHSIEQLENFITVLKELID